MRSTARYIVVNDVHKEFKPSAPVISGISMTIARGELVALFGPNGCGKTTLLRILTGLDDDHQGRVKINDRPPEQVNVGIVPQESDDALLPWRTVLENITLPLEIDNLPKRDRARVVHDFIEKMGLRLHPNMYPYQLSGGQKRLVAIARAMIGMPDLLILDEPFSSLDFDHIRLVQEALLRLWEHTQTTTILVTHDLYDAVYLADRVVLLSPRPMRVLSSQEIDLPRPRSRQDPRLISVLNKFQHIYLGMK